MTCSILIPAHDEAAWLPDCLAALLASDPVKGGVQVIVIANGCSDDTAEIARGFAEKVQLKGWALQVITRREGGKTAALNAGENVATGSVLVYLDADVTVSPPLLAGLVAALEGAAPRYASGQPRITGGQDLLTRAYARFWRRQPFVQNGVPGFGLFAVNRPGRARWGGWPDIISDDTFARLHFRREERVAVAAAYDWPMIEGFGQLVRVRRRQDRGVAEVAHKYPQLQDNHDAPGGGAPLWRRTLGDPVGFAVYCAVRMASKMPARRPEGWARGR